MSVDIRELEEKKASYIRQGQKALDAGDVRKAERFTQEAENVAATIKSHARLSELAGGSDNGAQPFRPQLPGTNGSSNGSDFAAKAATITALRFGNVEDAVKGILTDLHGGGYEGAYMHQRQAFRNYLRRGEQLLSRGDYDILKTIVMTPTAVKGAIMQGIDDVASLKATMVEAIDTLGGFVVPVDFQMDVIERMKGLTVMRGRASVDTTSRDVVEMPVSTGGDDQYSSAVRVTWVDETPAPGVANTNLTFGMEQIPIHTVMAETVLSRNLIEDAAFNIEQFLSKKFAESSAIDEDNKFLTGSGVGTPQGILPGGTNANGLQEVPSLDAAKLSWDGLLDLVYAVPSQYRDGCVFMGERKTYRDIAKLKSSANDYLWKPFQFDGGAEGAPPKLLGFPTLEQEVLPTVGAAAYPLIFGDPKGYQIFDRVGMTVERYLDSQTARQNMVMFIMRRRLGGQVIEPWRFAIQKIST